MASDHLEHLIVERVDGGVGVVTLNRPSKLNALSYPLMRELDSVLNDFEIDDDIRCVVITGSGEKAFSAGGDIHEMAAMSTGALAERDWQRSQINQHLGTFKLPTIGAINGLAYGGAAALSTMLDIRIGCERSSFRFLAAAYGRVNSTWTLPVVVGWARAKELLYTGRVVAADEAREIGLLNELVPSGELMARAIEMGRQIASNVPDAVQGIKEMLLAGSNALAMFEAERDGLSAIEMPTVAEGFKEFLTRKGP